jgi:hypothetical protein
MLIDSQTASAAVELQEKINNACNDASLIRNMAGAMWVGFFVRLIPFFGLVGLVVIVLFVVVVVKLIIWQVRYGSIRTTDVDYKQAYRNWIIALALWGLMLIAPVVMIFLFAGLIAATSQ